VDLMGPMRSESMEGKKYILVIVDDYSRFTWVILLKDKSEACDQAKILFKRIQNEKGCVIQRIRSNHRREFENSCFENLCEESSIKQEFSSPITQHNGVIKRKNRVIQDIAQAMLHAQAILTASPHLGRSYQYCLSHY
jgi:hypothetical protein